jgi:hypothetical protein
MEDNQACASLSCKREVVEVFQRQPSATVYFAAFLLE